MRRGGKGDIGDLAQELDRLRRRAARQKRNIGSNPEAWRKWSATTDEIANLSQQLLARPANDLEGLATKFTAILWLIEINESLLDSGDLKRLRRFGRDLAILAGDEA